MAWENLQSIVLNGNTVNLSILDTTGINWVANASNQAFTENTSASADGSNASGIFKLTSSSDVISHNGETYDLGNEYYFQFGYYGNPYQQCSILLKKGNTTYGYGTNRGTNKYPILFGIIVNHETHKAKFWGYNDNALNNNHAISAQWVTSGSYDDFCTLLYNLVMSNQPVPAISSNGGGATHIAKVTGQLSSLSNNLSDILMVSGGGGGGLLSGETEYTGKEAGGISGSGDNSADQTTGNAFGLGESGTNVSGGGSGLYGGYKGTSSKSGGAGSGYIGNSLVSNKKMVGYNVPTSSAESTKTKSVNEASESPVSGKPKIGNGYAKIKLLREPVQKTIEELAKNANFIDHSKRSSLTQAGPAMPNSLSDLQEYYGTDWNLIAYIRSSYTYSNGVFSRTQDSGDWRYIVIPLKDTYTVTAISIDVKELDRTADWNGIQFWLGKYSGSGTPYFTDLEDGFIAAAKKPTAMSSTHNWFIEIPANSTDFNTLNAYMSGPVSGVNYIAFCTWAAEMQIKNIKLTVIKE